MANRQPDQSYVRVWNTYTRFVDTERQAGRLPEGNKYITRQNVDRYFDTVVKTLKVLPTTAARHGTAIQWYAHHREHMDDENPFIVKTGRNSIVQRALDEQANNYANSYLVDIHDAHENLPTNVLSKRDHKRVIQHVLSTNLRCYKDFGISWTVCHSTYLRLDSLMKMRLCDLRADNSHGPFDEGPNATILSLIMQPYQHKDDGVGANQRAQNARDGSSRGRTPTVYKKRVVGVYRHINFEQCATGQIAMSLFMRLHNNYDISFLKPAENNALPTWQRVKLIQEWTSDRSPQTTYTRILRQCNVSWNKVTHLRSAGMEHGSAQGELNADAVATMSKHRQDRLFQSYMTELFPPVMRVMAGLKAQDPYFVSRTEIEPPFSTEEQTRMCFPNIDVWKQQRASPHGDKHRSAENFLSEILPFLSRVLIQDGPYWLRKYPNHPYTLTFFGRMPATYINWARGAVAAATRLEESRNVENVENLNAGARHAFEHQARSNDRLSAAVDGMTQETREIRLATERNTARLLERMDQQQQQINHQNDFIVQLLQSLQQGGQLTQAPQAPNPPAAVAAQQRRHQQQQQQQQLRAFEQQARQVREAQRRQQRAADAREANARRRPVNNVLRAVPREPPGAPKELPPSMVSLVEQWRQLNMENHRPIAVRRLWPDRFRVMYSKWMYLFEKVRSRANHGAFAPHLPRTNEAQQRQRLRAAAEAYDHERGNRSMNNFRRALTDADKANGNISTRNHRN